MKSDYARKLEQAIKKAIHEYAIETGCCVDTVKIRYTPAAPKDRTSISLKYIYLDEMDVNAFVPIDRIYGGEYEKPDYEKGK